MWKDESGLLTPDRNPKGAGVLERPSDVEEVAGQAKDERRVREEGELVIVDDCEN